MSIQCTALESDIMVQLDDTLNIIYNHIYDPDNVIRVNYIAGDHMAYADISNTNYVGVDASFLKYYNYCNDLCFLSRDKIVLIKIMKKGD